MTRFLLSTDSVHTTAVACDYLDGRLADGDAVTALAVVETDGDDRDAGDALNVATARLGGLATVETTSEEGAPAESILAAAADADVDEVVVGSRSGVPGTETDLGSTARSVAAQSTVPVVVVPVPRLD